MELLAFDGWYYAIPLMFRSQTEGLEGGFEPRITPRFRNGLLAQLVEREALTLLIWVRAPDRPRTQTLQK